MSPLCACKNTLMQCQSVINSLKKCSSVCLNKMQAVERIVTARPIHHSTKQNRTLYRNSMGCFQGTLLTQSLKTTSCVPIHLHHPRFYGIDSFDDGHHKQHFLPLTYEVPKDLTMVPLVAVNNNVPFPRFIRVVDVLDKKLAKMIMTRMRMGLPFVAIFMTCKEHADSVMVKDVSELFTVGTLAHINSVEEFENTRRLRLHLKGCRRTHLIGPLEDEMVKINETITEEESAEKAKQLPQLHDDITGTEISASYEESKMGLSNFVYENFVRMVQVENVDEETKFSDEITALSQEVTRAIRNVLELNPVYRANIQPILDSSQNNLENPYFLADLCAAFTQAPREQLQEMLEEPELKERLMLALTIVKKEEEVVMLQNDIAKEVEEKVTKMHRRAILFEQLKIIKKELGIEKDDKDAIQEKFKARLKDKVVPAEVMTVIEEELNKLSFLESHSSEFGVTRNYLDWLTILPWGVQSSENLDLKRAQEILDEDHYGMEDVKKRILEFIAVAQLRGSTQGKMLCFHGPPGVGKTSIARSIARTLNREYFRFSVGGMRDVAEIKGHRRTYIGAMPGKIIQCLKKTGTENPVILIDEIDKINAGWSGDPSAALLEVLDPEQNSSFLDHYLDVNVDLSKVLFICTANVLETIPDPLKDRMEIIELSGYVAEEKVQIANTYLIPNARKDSGIEEDKLEIIPDALNTLIKGYCRESGVRSLQKHIERIMRRVAYNLATESSGSKVVIKSDNLKEFVGKAKYTKDRMYDITPPGVVMGLAWTNMGGSALFIETTARPVHVPVSSEKEESSSKAEGSLETTGHLGDVMKESVKIAYTYSKNFLSANDPENTMLLSRNIHLHVPDGAVPKDGPSAGVTIVTALLSLAKGVPVRQDVAMTGELSLTGKVLPVGGIKEKTIAAKRSGVSCIILPSENEKDYHDLPKFITEGLEVHFVSNYEDVYKIAFDQ